MFKPITTAPSANDPHWINVQYGGLNKCIVIDKSNGSVLPNCTGFAYGAWMFTTGTTKCNLPTGDAGNWYRASASAYEEGQTPKVGAIACWSGGVNGQGHVAIVNHVHEDGTIEIAESGYYSKIRFMTETLPKPYNMSGLKFQGFIYNPAVEQGKYRIVGGKQISSYLNQPIFILGQRDEWKIGMVSAKGENPHTALQTIDHIDSEEIVIFGSMNSNYFQMRTDDPVDPYGEHYGTEISFTNEFCPHKGNVLAYALLKTGGTICVPDSSFYYTRNDTEFACAPAYAPYINGDRVDLWSEAFKGSKARATQQTMLIRTQDRFALAVCSGALTIQQLTEWAELTIEGLQDLIFMDSGGSSQIMIGYDLTVYTGREIPNVICFYQPKSADSGDDSGEDGEPQPSDPKDAEIASLKAENEALKDKLDRIKSIIEEEV